MPTIANGAVEGNSAQSFTAVTATYTVLTTDEVVQADATAGSFTVSLPAPSTMTGQVVRVVKTNSANAVTVNGALPQYIRVAGKSVLNSNGSQVQYLSDGTFWNVLGTVS